MSSDKSFLQPNGLEEVSPFKGFTPAPLAVPIQSESSTGLSVQKKHRLSTPRSFNRIKLPKYVENEKELSEETSEEESELDYVSCKQCRNEFCFCYCQWCGNYGANYCSCFEFDILSLLACDETLPASPVNKETTISWLPPSIQKIPEIQVIYKEKTIRKDSQGNSHWETKVAQRKLEASEIHVGSHR